MDDFCRIFRPKNIEEMVGQSHLTDKKSAFYRLIKAKKIPHLIFFGPPGSGKTTMAKIISNELDFPFYELDATGLKVEELRKIIRQYKNSLIKPLIFIDEIHRLSKNQQEVLLIPMEKNEAVIIGASTENPYFTLTNAIRSRSMLFEFKTIQEKDLIKLLKRVQKKIDFEIEEEAISYLASSSNGDGRAMLNLLEYALAIDKKVTIQTLKSLRQIPLKDGTNSKDTHYALTSAMIKSIRGSDIDAALYYLARLIDGGENPEFIARRLVILSSEDIGNANPNALNLAVNTMNAVAKIGYPESRIILSQCVVYLSSSPKSNSCYQAINSALKYIEENENLPVLKHLKSPSLEGYLYPHDFGGWVKQRYLGKDLKFYQSKNIGFEKTLTDWIKKIRNDESDDE